MICSGEPLADKLSLAVGAHASLAHVEVHLPTDAVREYDSLAVVMAHVGELRRLRGVQHLLVRHASEEDG
eukprot:scaffold6653_cov105-Phaeocystis_antarctica.AAC.4